MSTTTTAAKHEEATLDDNASQALERQVEDNYSAWRQSLYAWLEHKQMCHTEEVHSLREAVEMQKNLAEVRAADLSTANSRLDNLESILRDRQNRMELLQRNLEYERSHVSELTGKCVDGQQNVEKATKLEALLKTTDTQLADAKHRINVLCEERNHAQTDACLARDRIIKLDSEIAELNKALTTAKNLNHDLMIKVSEGDGDIYDWRPRFSTYVVCLIVGVMVMLATASCYRDNIPSGIVGSGPFIITMLVGVLHCVIHGLAKHGDD